MLPAMLVLALSAGADLRAAAAASGRPSECASTVSASRGAPRRGSVLWDRARRPARARYCDLVAWAAARLPTNPSRAMSAARRAAAMMPTAPGAHISLARAALAAGDTPQAVAQFDQAERLDPRALSAPLVLRDLALARWRHGQLDRALESYRALAPRTSLLPSRDERVLTMLRAAHVAMTVAQTPPHQAAELLREAGGYLRQAARETETRHRDDVLLSLALVLDRAGASARAAALLDERGARVDFDESRARSYLVTPADAHALTALATERTDGTAAARHWRAYLATQAASGRYRRAAERHLAGQRTKRRTRRGHR